MQLFVVDMKAAPRAKSPTAISPNGGNEFGPNRASLDADGKYLIASVNRHPESDHEFLDTEVYDSVSQTARFVSDHSQRP